MTHKNLHMFLSNLMLLKSPSLWNYIIKRSLFFPYSCTTGLDFVTKGKERGSRNWKTPPCIFVGRSDCKCGDKLFHHRVRGRKVGYLRWAAADGDWGPFERKTGRQGKTRKDIKDIMFTAFHSPQTVWSEDQKLADLIDGAEPLVCGELQDWIRSIALQGMLGFTCLLQRAWMSCMFCVRAEL